MKKIKKHQLAAIAGLAALALITGAFAFWNQTSSIENPFDTGKYGSMLKEDFNPNDGENWQPGVTVDKVVTVKNTGNFDLIVRVKLDEKWARSAGASTSDAGQVYKDSAATVGGYDLYEVYQADAGDGLTAADKSVVIKNFSASSNWIKGADGWNYYKAALPGGQSTDEWLKSVTLLHDADMGKIEVRKYVSASTDTDEAAWLWVEYSDEMPAYLNAAGQPCEASDAGARNVLHNKSETVYVKNSGIEIPGYGQSDYTLTVTMQTVQATQDALDALFGGGSAFAHPAGTAWVLKGQKIN